MNGRNSDTTTSSPITGERTSRQALARLVIGPDVKISGAELVIETKGIVQIDGEVNGDIHAHQVIISEGGTVRGAICGDEVRVHGIATGSIKARYVTLQPCSVFTGKIFHHSLTINTGARFEGTVRREEQLANYSIKRNSDPIAELSSLKDRRPRLGLIEPAVSI